MSQKLGLFSILCEGRAAHVGGCLYKDNASLFSAGYCVMQAPLLIVAANDRRRPENNDVIEFSVLGAMNRHPFLSTSFACSGLAALGEGLLDQIHDLFL
ncbi:hypothetical protein [Achromobacter insuavis]|uniref:hypothetical protein n=1 Tax=Achromobacter insuavis TaxID=1287735 RepID=UPI0029DA0B0B|nr:hypothetical protein [Achromobacter sp.]MCG2602108.1 hypothetical protein [Achromobacter sp.]